MHCEHCVQTTSNGHLLGAAGGVSGASGTLTSRDVTTITDTRIEAPLERQSVHSFSSSMAAANRLRSAATMTDDDMSDVGSAGAAAAATTHNRSGTTGFGATLTRSGILYCNNHVYYFRFHCACAENNSICCCFFSCCAGVAVERIYGDTVVAGGSRAASLSGSDVVDLTQQHHNGGVSMIPGGGGGGAHHVTRTERSYHTTSVSAPQTSYMAGSELM